MLSRFKYHNRLIPKIWDKENQLNHNVHKLLLDIVNEYIFFLSDIVKLPVSCSDIYDVLLHGSITNYYWDKHSDIDICIIIDLSKIKQKLSGLDCFFIFNALMDKWKKFFTMSVYGRNVDIWMMDASEFQQKLANSIDTFYSLAQNKWILKPIQLQKSQIQKVQHIAQKKYRVIMRQCRQILRTKQPPVVIDKYLINIRKYRGLCAQTQHKHPLTSGVLAFKMARNTGIFTKMRKKSKKELSKKFILK